MGKLILEVLEGKVDLNTVQGIAEVHGIVLEGEKGIPYHCDQRMKTYAGIVGTDYAVCKVCGLAVGRIDSPHINGGIVLKENALREIGDRLWFTVTPPNKERD